jgi:hypothetical protein
VGKLENERLMNLRASIVHSWDELHIPVVSAQLYGIYSLGFLKKASSKIKFTNSQAHLKVLMENTCGWNL